MSSYLILLVPAGLIFGLLWRPDITLQVIGLLQLGLMPLAHRMSQMEPVPSFGDPVSPMTGFGMMFGGPLWINLILSMLFIGLGRVLFYLRRLTRARRSEVPA